MKYGRLTLIAGLAALVATPAMAQTIAIGTTKGGATASIAAAIAKVVSQKAQGLQMRTRPFGGTQQYIPVVNKGEVAVGLSNLPQYHMAKTGTGLSKRKHGNLQLLANMMVFQVAPLVADKSGIKNTAGLKGKRIPHGFKAAPLFSFITAGWLANGDLSYADVKKIPAVGLRQHWNMLSQGKIDVVTAALGTGAVKQMNAKITGGVRFLSLDNSPAAQKRLFGFYPKSYLKQVKPSKRLTGVKGPTYTLNYDYMLWAHNGLDAKVVYKIVKAMYDNEAVLKKASPLWRSHSSKTMAKDQGYAYHKGAVKFYKEAGIWKR